MTIYLILVIINYGDDMAFTTMFLLEVVIVFSFIVTSLFMFITKDELVHKIFFSLAIMLGIMVTVVSATSMPPEMIPHIVLAWLGLIPAAVGILVCISSGKPNAFAKICVMATTVYGVVCYFLL